MHELLKRFSSSTTDNSLEYGQSLLKQQLEEGRWWTAEELRGAGITTHRMYKSYIEALINYKLGLVLPEMVDPLE